MAKKDRFVTFRNKDGSVAFVVADGGSIFIDGKEHDVTYINEGFFLLDLKCYAHRTFFREFIEEGECKVVGGRGVVPERVAAEA